MGRRLGSKPKPRGFVGLFGERPEVGLLYERELDRGPVFLGETSGRIPDPASIPRGQRVRKPCPVPSDNRSWCARRFKLPLPTPAWERGALPHPELVATGNPRPVGEALPDAVIDPVLVGLRRVLSERYGTGRDIEEVPGCTILGKTGTAEVPPITIGEGRKMMAPTLGSPV